MLRLATIATPLALAGILALGGCGSDDDKDSATTAPKVQVPKVAEVPKDGGITVDASEYKFSPVMLSAKAGDVKITMKNVGKMPHELVVLKSKANQGALKTDKDDRVSEKGSLGEIEETEAGKSGTHTFKLKKGTYVFVCNIPGHYRLGMRGTITVQ